MKILLANLTKMVNDSGGMAKVTCAFAKEMKDRGHEVSLVYSDEQEGEFYFPWDESIPRYDVRNLGGKRQGYPLSLRLKRELYRVFSKEKARTINNDFAEMYLKEPTKKVLDLVHPDVIVSFQPAATKLLLMDIGTKIPIVTMSHGDPEDYFHFYPKAEIPAVEQCAMNQVLLPSFKEHLQHHLPKARVTVIGNAIPQFEEQADLAAEKEIYTIGFLARLAKNHKQPHILVEAFCKLANQYPNWQVKLWGAKEGEAFFKQMQLTVKTHGLEERIHFMGSTNDVKSALLSCDIFAFPSAYEGFSLSLGEAMSLGLPTVGFQSSPSVNEMIQHEVTGLLAKDGVDGFAKSLAVLMDNQELRIHYGQAAKENIKAFGPSIIWDEWESLLEEIVE